MPISVQNTLFASPVLPEDMTSALKQLRRSRALYLRNANQKLADMHEEGKGKEGEGKEGKGKKSKDAQPSALSSMANLYAGMHHLLLGCRMRVLMTLSQANRTGR